MEPFGDDLGSGRYPLGGARTWLNFFGASEPGSGSHGIFISLGRVLVSSILSQK